jgi:FkbH-like protein
VAGLQRQNIACEHMMWETYVHAPPIDFEEARYDAVVAAITQRHILADAAHRLEPRKRPGNSIYWPRVVGGREQEYLDACRELLAERIRTALALCPTKPIFFLSFLEPRHNYLGNLLPRYQLSNPAHFIRKLNEAQEEFLADAPNARLFDVNEILNLVGRARLQDDIIWSIDHGSIIADDPADAARIQASTDPRQMYDTAQALEEYERVLALRLREDLAIMREPLQIKAIIVDLDDTVWRGIAAEDLDKNYWEFTEGWPIGLAEALLVFKTRGGLLAACSKNDEAALRLRWPTIYFGRLRLADFAAMRINFGRKSDNVRELLRELNVLPRNTLFIDDNPREIDEVRRQFPDMHFLSSEHYDWRRKILLSPATQVASISDDARLRTTSIQANSVREKAKAEMSHDDWLRSLELVQTTSLIGESGDPDFQRAFELLNKTNQFNTTGRRWTLTEMEELFARGGLLLCSKLRDRLADSGMISVFVIDGSEIAQAVLSCRAFGFGAEAAAAHVACAHILAHSGEVRASLADTGLNATCHRFYEKLGFTETDGSWRTTNVVPAPVHIDLRLPIPAAPASTMGSKLTRMLAHIRNG